MSTPNTEQLEQELKKAIRERDDALALLGLYKINTQEHKETITKLSIERNELKESVFALQDLQHSIGIALMEFGKQLTRNTKHE